MTRAIGEYYFWYDHLSFVIGQRRAGGPVLRHFWVFLSFWSVKLQFFCKFLNQLRSLVFLWFILSWEAKSSTKVEDEASALIFLRVFMFSLYSICRLIYYMFVSIQLCDKIIIGCCLWIIKRPIFVVFRSGVHRMIGSRLIFIVIYGYCRWFDLD